MKQRLFITGAIVLLALTTVSSAIAYRSKTSPVSNIPELPLHSIEENQKKGNTIIHEVEWHVFSKEKPEDFAWTLFYSSKWVQPYRIGYFSRGPNGEELVVTSAIKSSKKGVESLTYMSGLDEEFTQGQVKERFFDATGSSAPELWAELVY